MLLPLLQNNVLAANDTNVAANLEQLTLTTFPATIEFGANVNVAASVEQLTLTTFAAGVSYDVTVSAATEALTLTTFAADVNLNVTVSASTEALTLTEYPATITFDANIQAATEQLTLRTFAASITGGGVSATVTTGNIQEVQLRQYPQAVFVSLNGTNFVSGQAWIDVRQSIIDNLTSNLSNASEPKNFTKTVKRLMRTPNIVRLSDTILRIDLPVAPDYNVTQDEVVTITLPAGATEAAEEIVVA